MKRILIACALLLSSVPVSAQLTTMPIPNAQWFSNTGTVLDAGGLCVFAAGTSTLETTYTTATGSVANANPVLFNSAGRPTTGGVFLTPGTSYKFVLKDFTGVSSKTCVPDTGTTIWSVDGVQAVPGSASAVDVTGTAGESITAGEAVYLSDGAGGLNTGQWYLMDSDLSYKSTQAIMVGVAPNDVASGAVGSFRISGSVTMVGPLSTGLAYYAASTPGAITITPPTNAIRLGVAQSATEFLVGYTKAPVSPRGPPCGRLTLTSGLPVTISDVTAATTLYYTPAGSCNTIALYDGTAWSDYAFTELSITNAGLSASKPYDVWAYDNAGVVTLELLVWTNDTTRATALALQNGVYVKSGTATRRYLGTIYTDSASKFNDAYTLRHVWNYYNRVPSSLQKLTTTDNWTYTTATWRQAAADAANQLDFVVGVGGDAIDAQVRSAWEQTNASIPVSVSVGLDSTTTPSPNSLYGEQAEAAGGYKQTAVASYRSIPAAGRHTLVWLEWSTAGTGTTTWYGDTDGTIVVQSGIHGTFTR